MENRTGYSVFPPSGAPVYHGAAVPAFHPDGCNGARGGAPGIPPGRPEPKPAPRGAAGPGPVPIVKRGSWPGP